MISQKMEHLVKNSSVIRAMFEEGSRLASIYGAENVFDFSIGNPSVTPPDEVRQAITEILSEENPLTVHGYMTIPATPRFGRPSPSISIASTTAA